MPKNTGQPVSNSDSNNPASSVDTSNPEELINFLFKLNKKLDKSLKKIGTETVSLKLSKFLESEEQPSQKDDENSILYLLFINQGIPEEELKKEKTRLKHDAKKLQTDKLKTEAEIQQNKSLKREAERLQNKESKLEAERLQDGTFKLDAETLQSKSLQNKTLQLEIERLQNEGLRLEAEIKQNQSFEIITVDTSLLRKFAYAWHEFYPPANALKLLVKEPFSANNLVSLAKQIYFVKELILSDTQNQFISDQEFKKSFESFIATLKNASALTDAVLLLEKIYTLKVKTKLINYSKTEKTKAENTTIDAKSDKGLLSIYTEKTPQPFASILDAFVNDLRQYMRHYHLQIAPADLAINKLPFDITNKPKSTHSNAKESNPRSLELKCIKLTAWVTGSILFYIDIKARSKCVEHWINVATELNKSGDYDAAFAIFLGLTHSDIERLTKTLAQMPDPAKDRLKQLNVFFNHSHGFQHFKEQLEAEKIANIFMTFLISVKTRIQRTSVKPWKQMQIAGGCNYHFFHAQYAFAKGYDNGYHLNINIDQCISLESTNGQPNSLHDLIVAKRSQMYEPAILKLTKFTEYLQIGLLITACHAGYAPIEVITHKKNHLNPVVGSIIEEHWLGIDAINLLLNNLTENKERFKQELAEHERNKEQRKQEIAAEAKLYPFTEILEKLNYIATLPINQAGFTKDQITLCQAKIADLPNQLKDQPTPPAASSPAPHRKVIS